MNGIFTEKLFYLDKNSLIPRQDTELLIDLVLNDSIKDLNLIYWI